MTMWQCKYSASSIQRPPLSSIKGLYNFVPGIEEYVRHCEDFQSLHKVKKNKCQGTAEAIVHRDNSEYMYGFESPRTGDATALLTHYTA